MRLNTAHNYLPKVLYLDWAVFSFLRRTQEAPSHHPSGVAAAPTPHGKKKHTLNLAHLTSSFVWPIQLSLLHILLFKVLIRKYFTQGKCDSMKFLFLLSGKIKI
jgi:hypothetical protein